jgi:hypothetical protein
MPLIDDPRFSPSTIVGDVNTSAFFPRDPLGEPQSPPILDTLAAASRRTFPGGLYERIANRDPDGPDTPPGFDALDHIQGFEDFADEFVTADSPAEVEGIKSRLTSTMRDRETLHRAGLGGAAAEIALGLVDPTFWVAVAVPEIAIARYAIASKVLTSAARGAAGAGGYEFAMHSIQEGRTLSESAFNIGGGALLGGVLGTLSRRVPKEESDALLASLKTEAIRSEAGAAAVARPTTLEAESIARGGKWFSKLAGFVPVLRTDAQRILESESIAARTTLEELADIAPLLEKNTAGIATPTSVESLVARHEGRIADFAEELRRLYAAHRKDPRPVLVGTPALKREEFYAAVSGAARRGDYDLFPHVKEAAKYLRGRVFDPLKQEAQRLGLLPKDVEVVGAESYFMRRYSRESIRANRAEWDDIISKHYAAKGIDPAEARSLTADITRRILGADVGESNFNIRARVPDAGALHERVLDIRDEMIEKFLDSDPVKIAGSYVRELAPQIEITKRFGDKDMKDALDKVRQEFDVRRERVRFGTKGDTSKPLGKLQDEEREVVDALIRVRDRIYGRAGRLTADAGESTRRTVAVARGWRNIVASARLGTTALTSSAQDTARIVAQYGFAPTMTTMAKLIGSPAFRQLKTAQARRMGAAVEATLARRVNVAFDGSPTEGWTEALANGVYKYTGLNHWTDFARTLGATLCESRVLQAASDVAGGRTLDQFVRTRLAALGLDEAALRGVHAQVSKHGGAQGEVRMSGSAEWDDYGLAQRYDAAILKESRTVVMQPGAADRVWWMDSETGRVIGQIKSFAIAAPLKLAMTPFQLIGQRQYLHAARFVGAMMVGGYLAHSLRQLASGAQPQTDPGAAAAEAFAESGLAGVLPDIVSPLSRRLGIFGESARFADRNVMSAFGGPALGTLGDAYDFSMNRTANGMSAKDLQLLRRLLPYQNIWWLRRAINTVQGETAEAFDLPGADSQSFGARLSETRPLLSTGQRGGTGTGAVVQ